MTRQEKYQEGVELAWAELEEAEERRRVAGLDFEPVGDSPQPKPVPVPVRPRHPFTITLITQPGNRRTTYPVQAFDKDHAEFMALAAHTTKNGEVTSVYGPLNNGDVARPSDSDTLNKKTL